jgi:pectate lyase
MSLTSVRALCAAITLLPALAAADHSPVDEGLQIVAGGEVLGAHDGWASVPTAALPNGTTGGSSAAPERWHIVTNRAQLVAALAFPDPTPKRIYIQGEINANVDDANQPLSCESYYRPDPTTGEMYSLAAFLAAYDPTGPWGRVNPSGPQERARVASAAAQAARVRIRVPANTTIYGIGERPTLRGAWLDIRPSSTSGNQPMNVIIRNVHFEDSGVDCFPQWSPTDGSQGNWNAAYDAISVRNSTHVWIDHNRFEDVQTADETLPVLFGRLYQVHDGHLDITNESDYVTVTYNQFLHHDKTMLIGSSDSAVADRGKLRVTLHHNHFGNVGQRVPRVRFGQVHVYNNYFFVGPDSRYGYSWGVGVESQIYAENNFFELKPPYGPADVIDRFNGTRITDTGNCLDVTPVGGDDRCDITDFVGAWNAAFDPDLIPDAGWTPTLYGAQGAAHKAKHTRHVVEREAGPSDTRGHIRK